MLRMTHVIILSALWASVAIAAEPDPGVIDKNKGAVKPAAKAPVKPTGAAQQKPAAGAPAGPAKVKAAAVAKPAVVEPPVIDRFYMAIAGGYYYGIGDIKSPHAEFTFNYLLPLLDNSISIGLAAGWYTGTEIEKKNDDYFGPYENEWHMTALPVALNGLYWYRFSPGLTFLGGAGLEYVPAEFTFESRNSLGDIDPKDVINGAAIGSRLTAGVRYTLGPGAILGNLKYSTSNIKNDFSEFTGDLGGLSLVAGYEFGF